MTKHGEKLRRRSPPLPLEDEAASWIVKQDRGLTPEETEQLQRRITACPELGAALDQSRSVWRSLDRLSADEVADARYPLHWQRYAAIAAAILLCGLLLWALFPTQSPETPEVTLLPPGPTTRLLPDSSIVRLNSDSRLEEKYSAEVRHVLLLSGEAHFKVKPDAGRPFIVQIDDIRIEAVGTAFQVQHGIDQVDVIVTEGTVRIDADRNPPNSHDHGASLGETSSGQQSPPLVSSGERARIRKPYLEQPRFLEVEVTGANRKEVSEALAWQQPLLTLGGDTLGNIARSFEQKTGMHLEIADPALLDLRIGGRFPSDEPKRFLQILETNYGIHWREKADGRLVVGKY